MRFTSTAALASVLSAMASISAVSEAVRREP
jgi:hypothetical protein